MRNLDIYAVVLAFSILSCTKPKSQKKVQVAPAAPSVVEQEPSPSESAPSDQSPGPMQAMKNPLPLPLKTCGRHIVDAKDNVTKLISVNIPGASDRGMVPYGLDTIQLRDMAKLVKEAGFNSIRLPYADVIFLVEKKVPESLISANLEGPDSLKDMTPLQVFYKTVEIFTSEGLLVILNSHSTLNVWCCNVDDYNGLWNSLQSEATWIANIEKLARDFKDNPLVIGHDLRNEVRPETKSSSIPKIPTWGVGGPFADWKAAATKAGNAALKIAPHWLIFVAGINGGLDFRGIPVNGTVRLSVPNRLVYTPHTYSFSVDADTRQKTWGFIVEEGKPYTSPLWVGEFGVEKNGDWYKGTIQLFKDLDASISYWSFNADRYGTDLPKGVDALVGNDSNTLRDFAIKLMEDKAKEDPVKRRVPETFGFLSRREISPGRWEWFLDQESFRYKSVQEIKASNKYVGKCK